MQSQQQQPNQGHNQSNKGFPSGRLLIFIIEFILITIVAIIWIINISNTHSFLPPIIAVVFAALGLIFVLCQWMFPFEPISIHLIAWFHDQRQRWTKQTADVIISYNLSDYRWVSWIKCQLEGQGYLVGLQNCKENDFEEKIREARRHAKCVLTVLTPDYFDPLRINSERLKLFKKLNRLGGKGILVQVGECNQDEKLAKLTIIDLIGLNDKDALDKLIGGIHYQLGKHQEASAHSVPQSDCRPFPGDIPRNWNVPLLSPFFTGRKKELDELCQKFENGGAEESIKQLTISGLAGMGMTEVAVKYTYVYYARYLDILWLSMSPPEKHSKDLEKIVDQLGLTAQDLQSSPKEIIQWLESKDNWLLILDNCDDPNSQEVQAFIPQKGRGHILLTTGIDTTDAANTIHIVQWKPDEGALFLLRRSGTIKPDDPIEKACETDRNAAMEISHEIGHVPFALNFAGVFIYRTNTLLPNYLKLYKDRRPDLKKRFKNADDKTITWLLSFEKVKRPSAALLLFCAFLDPDEIPLELIQGAASGLTTIDKSTLKTELEYLNIIANDELELMDAVIELTQFCLIEQNRQTKTLTTHRLMQDTLKDEITRDEQHKWAELAVIAVNSAFPEVEFANWQQCQRYVAHAKTCAKHIENWKMESEDAIGLLYKGGCYTLQRGHYADAQLLLEQVRPLREKKSGTDPHLATCLNSLGEVYHAQGKYTKAKECYQQALTIRKNDLKLKPEHPDLVTSLHNLGRLYDDWSQRSDDDLDKKFLAEPLYQEVVNAHQQKQLSSIPDIPGLLNNLGWIYFRLGNFLQAEQCYKRVLEICDSKPENYHPDKAQSLANLASLYIEQKKYDKAERYDKAETNSLLALKVSEQTFGSDHPLVAHRHNNLAELFRVQGRRRYDLAEQHYKEALAIYKGKLGSKCLQVALVNRNYAIVLRAKNKLEEASRLEIETTKILTKHKLENP